MATPPFLPDESKPADNDIVSQYPAVERLFRDIMESWLLIDHDTDGEHTQITLPELALDPSAATNTGFVYTKDDAADTELFYRDDGGNVVQITKDGALDVPVGVLDAPTGTSMFFHQTAAPSGWTKDIAATLGNHALRVVTDEAWSAGSKGNTAFTSVFGASKTSGGKALSAADFEHKHETPWAGEQFAVPASGWPHGTSTARTANSFDITGSATRTTLLSGPVASLSSSTHNHTLSLDLNYINVIRATKD